MAALIHGSLSVGGTVFRAAALGLVVWWGGAATPAKSQEPDPAAVERGTYIFHAAGCYGCHTDTVEGAKPLAGNRPLETPFGTFYSPNITPDPEFGIGSWAESDLRRALKEGRSPEGKDYYPAFPYTSYSGMADQDVSDLWAYLQAQPAVPEAARAHDLDFPYSMRWTLAPWRWLYFAPHDFRDDPERREAWNRGAYLVGSLGHCGECHSPRGWLGAVDQDMALTGNPQGPEGKKVPGITPGQLSDWEAGDIAYYLQTGLTPDGDVAAGPMGEVIRHGTRYLSDEDRGAIETYLESLPEG